MTDYTDNLRVPLLDPAVAEPEIPENTAKVIFEQLLSGLHTYDFATDADMTITHTDSPTTASNWQNFILEFTSTAVLTGTRNVILPVNVRTYVLANESGYSLNFKTLGGTGFTLTDGSNAFAYSDGTNLIQFNFAATGAGTTVKDMTDTPSGYGTSTSVYMSNGTNAFAFYDMDNKLDADGGTIKNYGETGNALGSISGATTIDLADGNVVTATLTAAAAFTFSTTHTNTSFQLYLTNGNLATFTTTVLWKGGAPTLSVTGKDLLSFTKIGSDWIGVALVGVA